MRRAILPSLLPNLLFAFLLFVSLGLTIDRGDTADTRVFQPYVEFAIPDLTNATTDTIDYWGPYHIAGCGDGSVSPVWTATLPAGVSVNSSTGRITGTPTTPGTVSASLTCTNSVGSVVDNFTWTISGITDPPIVAGFFVDCSTGTTGNGTSHANRWDSLSDVNGHSFSTGDDVYLLAGSVCEDQTLLVDWGGTTSDNAVIGCYYMDGATPRECGVAQAKPEINGTYEESCRSIAPDGSGIVSTCARGGSAVPPEGLFGNGLVSVAAGNVTIENIRIQDSQTSGIKADAAYLASRANIRIERVDVIRTIEQAIWVNRRPANSIDIIKDNTADQCALMTVDSWATNWPPCINVDSTCSGGTCTTVHALLENNTVTNSGGEGISLIRVSGGIMRNNLVMQAHRIGIYVDNGDNNIVEHNRVYGYGIDNTGTTHYGTGGSDFLVAYGMVNENYGATAGSSTGNVIRNNVAVNHQSSLQIDCGACSNQVGGEILGNTFANDRNTHQFFFVLSAASLAPMTIQNNLFGGVTGCSLPTDGTDLTVSYNAWGGGTPSDTDCQGTNSLFGVDDGLTLDFNSANSSDIPTDGELTPANGSGADDQGLQRIDSIITSANYPQRTEFDYCVQTDSQWEQALRVDLLCNLRGATPDPGAVEH